MYVDGVEIWFVLNIYSQINKLVNSYGSGYYLISCRRV